ncbi:MAG TPA: hypothetical protein VIV54_18155 [Burkholderiales bacterium]
MLAGAAAFYGRGSRLGPILASLVLGPLCYFLLGVAVPRATGEGHFFSTPFGGLQSSDMELVTSILAWTLLWFALLFYAKRKN